MAVSAMNTPILSHNFAFYRLHFENEKYRYTDNRAGSPMNYIAYMVKGTAKIVSEHSTIYINEGDVFFIPHHLPYQSYWYGEDEITWLSLGFLQIEAAEKISFALQVIPCDDAAKELLLRIPMEGNSLHCETLALFYEALAKLLPDLKKNQSISRKEEIIEAAKKYIRDNTGCSIAEAAHSCYVSEPYLYLLFRELVGCTPNDYRQKAICQKGVEYLITTDKSVEEISALIGLSSASHFRRILKKHIGLTPRKLRKNSTF